MQGFGGAGFPQVFPVFRVFYRRLPVITGLVPVIHLSSWENRGLVQGLEGLALHLIGDFDQFGAGLIGDFSLFQLNNGAWKVVVVPH